MCQPNHLKSFDFILLFKNVLIDAIIEIVVRRDIKRKLLTQK